MQRLREWKCVSAWRMRNWKFAIQKKNAHGSKEKNTPYFLFFRKMVLKSNKRAKLKPFNSTSCRSAEYSPTLRSCLMHPLPRCPSCKSWQESLMRFKSKLRTCSQVNNYFNTTPNLTHMAKADKMITEISPSYHPGENGLSKCSMSQKNCPGSDWRGKAAKRDAEL